MFHGQEDVKPVVAVPPAVAVVPVVAPGPVVTVAPLVRAAATTAVVVVRPTRPAIIVAILIFGGLWGFWGVFFAIPLATLVQAVLKAWPSSEQAVPAAEQSG